MHIKILYFLLALPAVFPVAGTLSWNFAENAFEAVGDITDEFGVKDSSISILSSDAIQSDIIRKFSEKLKLCTGLLIFIMKSEDGIFQWVPQLDQIKGSFLVVIGDDTAVLQMIDALFQENILVWLTKVLVITTLHLTTNISHDQKKILSNANSMVLHPTIEDLSRWNLYFYMPFTRRPVQVAVWTPQQRLVKIPGQNLFPDKFTRLSDGGHLAVTTVIYPPHTYPAKAYKSFHKRKDSVPVSGPMVEVLNILGNVMNFTFSVSFPPDVAFGYLFQNGSWGGMVGQLARKEVDIALQLFSVSYPRAQVIDYTVPMMIELGRILSRRGETEINPWGYFLPLSFDVWLCLLFALILVMTTSFLLSITVTSCGASPEYPLENYIRMLLSQNAVTPIGSQWSRRTVVATWLIGTLIVLKAYSGNLSSLLIVRYVPQPHHSVKAVLDDPQVTAVMSGGGSFQQTLHSIKSGVFKKLADSESEGKMIFVRFTEFFDIIDQKISKGSHVILGEDLPMRVLTTRHYSEKGSCLFYFSREQFFSQILAPTVQKNSPLVPALNKRILMITESGLYSHWLDRVFVNASSCNKAPSKIVVESSLSLRNVWGMFVTLGCGYLLSIGIFYLELLIKFIHTTYL